MTLSSSNYKVWVFQSVFQRFAYRSSFINQRVLSLDPALSFHSPSASFSLRNSDLATKFSPNPNLQAPPLPSFPQTRFYYGQAYLGTLFSQIQSCCRGLRYPFFLRCSLKGVGYRVWKRKTLLFFKLGFTHRLSFLSPSQVSIRTHKYRFLISSFSKQRLTQLAKFLLFLRHPDAYKGKGIRYANDQVFQKSRTKDSKKRLNSQRCLFPQT